LIGLAQDYPRLYVRASLNSSGLHPSIARWGDNVERSVEACYALESCL